MSLKNEVLSRKKAAEDYLVQKRLLWDECEKLFHNQLNDSLSNKTKSQVFDPKLATLTLERGYRVMAQLPAGKVRGISKDDLGTSKLMNLILDRYVLPNANAQFDFLTKLRMIDIYSNVYGNFFAMVDWTVNKNGYVGPDMWLLNIRDVFPQVGAVSLSDSDYVIVRTWRPLSYFKSLVDKKGEGFTNVSKIVTKLEKLSGSKDTKDSNSISEREAKEYPESTPAKGKGYFEILSQYEGDRWVDYCSDADEVFRDIKNPHDNGELPLECKYSIPLLDDFMGMGDFERGKTMQMAINSIWNLYLDAVKISIFPPTLVNKDYIAAMSSIKWGPAEKWLVRGPSTLNAAQVLNLNPRGIETFQSTYTTASASLLNQFGTTDTTVTRQTEAGFGKTPQALAMQQTRENTRDNADRFYMEEFLTKVIKKMINLLVKKQPKALNIRLFGKEIDELKKSYPEIEKNWNQKKGTLLVSKEMTGSTLYDYEIVSGSTYAIDQKGQQDNLTSLLQLVLQNQNLPQILEEQGYHLNLGELFKRIISNSGIQDWDKIVEEKNEEGEMGGEDILKQDAQKFAQVLQQIQGQPNINQVPLAQQPTQPTQGENQGF